MGRSTFKINSQFSGFHGIVIPGTLRDSIFVLEGLLEQQTGLNPIEIMTDTAGTSDIVFGLFWLLGYQFSPRLADAGEAIFWRIDKKLIMVYSMTLLGAVQISNVLNNIGMIC